MISSLKIKYLNNIIVNKDSFDQNIKNIDIISKIKYDYFILNGNIGNPFEIYYENFLKYCFENISCKNIFIIAGDYEYSFDTYDNVNNKIKNVIDKFSNKITFFEKKCIFFRNISFIGCSLLKNSTEQENLTWINNIIEKSVKNYLEVCLISFNTYEKHPKFEKTLIYNINSNEKDSELIITLYN
jgi:hypothetical protein